MPKINLIKELGLEGLSEERQMNLLTLMTESLLKRITINALEKLSETERKEFDKVRETNDPDQVHEFLQSKIPGYDKMVKETIEEFKEEMKETAKNLQ
ncbi:MAG: DUF5663 domain-containing protein [Candidatus Parcubacteria bacterium]|nr:DUF5663 domain-containing protein [Candidatus Parcubacteria bacterium]